MRSLTQSYNPCEDTTHPILTHYILNPNRSYKICSYTPLCSVRCGEGVTANVTAFGFTCRKKTAHLSNWRWAHKYEKNKTYRFLNDVFIMQQLSNLFKSNNDEILSLSTSINHFILLTVFSLYFIRKIF